MERSAKIFTGDLGIYDSAVEIRSGDLVRVQSLTKTDGQLIEFYTKGLIAAGREHGTSECKWWLHSDDGLFRFMPEHHAIVGRLVCIAHRRRDLPLPEALQREHEAIASRSTPEYRADLHRLAQPALRAIKRDGPDRTTVFRKAGAHSTIRSDTASEETRGQQDRGREQDMR
jgi:hypothetical protein